MKFEKKDIFTIPNILTYIRFICLPFYLWMMIAYCMNHEFKYLLSGFIIFIFAEITDVVDGHIARKYNMISDIGKVIDPIADKLLQCFALITLAIIHTYLIVFMALLIVKEIFMAVSSRYFMVQSKAQVEQKSNKLGKAGAALNFVTIIVAFLVDVDYAEIFVSLGVDASSKFIVDVLPIINSVIKWLDIVLMVVSCVLAVAAATNYTIIYSKQLKAIRESGILDTLDKDGNPLPEKVENKED